MEKTTLRFSDKAIPALKCGKRYQISATQEIDLEEGRKDEKAVPVDILVAWPSLVLDKGEIHSLYPPAEGRGDFSRVVPHVVLNDPYFPWLLAEEDEIPWLALLLFQEGEIEPGEPGRADGSTPGVTGSPPRPPEGARWHAPGGDPWPVDQACRYIRIRRDLFQKWVPRPKERAFLVHVREVTDAGGEAREHSVVIGNRSPRPESDVTMHLVSLRGIPAALFESGTAADEEVCLHTLMSWSFRCGPARAENHFQKTCESLLRDARGGDLKLRRPIAPEIGHGLPARGYELRPWHSYYGEATLAWYRGPLAPDVATTRRIFPERERLARHEPQSNVMDVSLAAAWQLGRLLACSDGAFVADMHRLRRQIRRMWSMVRYVERNPGLSLQRLLETIPKEWSDAVHPLLPRTAPELPARKSGPWYARLAPPLEDDRLQRAVLAQKFGEEQLAELERIFDLDLFQTIAARLRRWLLLEEIDFAYLVPEGDDPRGRLPEEALRTFEIDTEWLSAFLDGAVSLAGEDNDCTRFADGVLRRMAWRFRPGSRNEELLAAIRDELLEIWLPKWSECLEPSFRENLPTVVRWFAGLWTPVGKVTGVLLRSSIVSDWPGLLPMAKARDGKPLPVLRAEALSENVAICLFDGEWHSLEIGEPAATVHFERKLPKGTTVGDAPVAERWQATGPLPATGVASTAAAADLAAQLSRWPARVIFQKTTSA